MPDTVSAPPAAIDPLERVFGIIMGFWQSRLLAVAAELDLAELLAGGRLSIDALAERSHTHAPSLFRMMRALESIDVFEQVEPGVFANTPASSLLRRDVPFSQWALVRTLLSKGFGQYDSWGEILHSVRTGGAAIEKVYGYGPWVFFQHNPEIGEVFNEAMRSASAAISPAVAAAYNWGRFPVIADVGGGVGSQLVAILDQHPKCRGVLLDRPAVIEKAAPHARIERTPGDFFESVPAGADAYTLRWIIHDWTEPDAIAILKNIRAAMKPDSRVVLIEQVIPDTPELTWSKWLDVHMMSVTGGRERTASEYADLLQKAGFALEEIIPTPASASLIIGRLQG